MVTMPDFQRTLADSWGEVVTKQGFDAPRGGKKRSHSTGYLPTKKSLRISRDAVDRSWSARDNVLRKYEASVARTVAREEAPIGVRPVPDMDSWASIHGVMIDSSEATKRGRRRFEIEEDGRMKRHESSALVSAVTSRGEKWINSHQGEAPLTRRRRCFSNTVEGQRSPVLEVAALEGFLSEMQSRLSFLEERAVRTGTPPVSALSKRKYPSDGMDTAVSSGPVDVFGVPQRLMENVEEARRRWEAHHDNLEMRDKDFLESFKRVARMADSQILVARVWRGNRILKKYSRWKRYRQGNRKTYVRAWHMVTKANLLYARNLKRFGFENWSDVVEEERNMRIVGIRALEATVHNARLSRQAVVRFFEEESHLMDGLSPAVARNRASIKRKISKGAFRISKAARLQTVSTRLWSPEWVRLLFHMWSRMTKFSRAVRERTNIPTFPSEEGNEFIPEWDSWVTNGGKRMVLKQKALQRGGQIFLHKFRRWATFMRWSTAQEERIKDATQHYHHYKINKVFTAWESLVRLRGAMMRRVAKYWAGWRNLSTRRKRTRALRGKVGEHVRLLRIGVVMEEMKAITRDGKIMAAFAVSKLLLTQTLVGGNILSYAVTGQSAHMFALMAWQAWKRFVVKRRRWKWLLYQHTKTEALHTKQTILRAWSFTKRRHSPGAVSPTLSASLPFSTWDRFIRSYVDRGITPRKQLLKDMVSHSVMQQNTTWWLVNRNIGANSRDSRNAGSSGCSADGKARGHAESQSCGSNAWGSGHARKRLGQLVNNSRSKEKVAAVTDWRTLGPALFKAVDECDTLGVSNLLRKGAPVNAVFLPPNGSGNGASKGGDRAQGEANGSTSALGYSVDLQAPTLLPLLDGTFEVRGSTPLHVAACRLSADFLPIVILLLHAGAWVDALDSAGKTPQQLCTSPQVAALLHEHTERLHAFDFSSREVCWGQEILTNEQHGVDGAALWRYITRVAILSRLEELHAALRTENKRVEDGQTEAQVRPSLGAMTGQSFEKSESKGSDRSAEMVARDVDSEEHEKELIWMKIERLERAKTIVEREHALNGRGLTTDGGGGGSESPDYGHDISMRPGKDRTIDEIREAFSCRRMEAATWFRSFRDSLVRADLLDSTQRTKGLKKSRACGSEEAADRVLAVLECNPSEIDVAALARDGKCERSVRSNNLSKPILTGLRGRGMSSSGTNAFNLVEANECWKALDKVFDRRRKVVSDRIARDQGLIERGTWDELQRTIVTGQETGQCASKHPSDWKCHGSRGNSPVMTPRRAEDRKMELIFPPASLDYPVINAAETSPIEEDNTRVEGTEGKEAKVLERFEKGKELVVHVIPTSASQRCHWASVAIRGTCEQQVLARALRTLAIWRTGNQNERANGEKEKKHVIFGQELLSRIPKTWWGNGGERVLALMHQERRKMFRKRKRLTSQARALEDRLASVAENLQELKNREHEIGTTVRKVAVETRKSKAKLREDMERWHKKMRQANTKIRSITRKRVVITYEIAALEHILANWDTREQPTAAERAMRKKNNEEDVTRETLERDIGAKRELVSKLNNVEEHSKKTVEIAEQKLDEGRVFLVRAQAILAKYSSYSMGEMETLEKEFKLYAKQHRDAKDGQTFVAMQRRAESRRLEELERGIGILEKTGVLVPLSTRSSDSANDLGRSNGKSSPRQRKEVSAATSRDANIYSRNSTNEPAAQNRNGGNRQTEDAGRHQLSVGSGDGDGDDNRTVESKRRSDADKPLRHVDGTAITHDNDALWAESARNNSYFVSSLDILKTGDTSRFLSREGEESAMVSLLCLINENATNMQADLQSLYKSEPISSSSGISQRMNGKSMRPKSPAAPTLFVYSTLSTSQSPEKDEPEPTPILGLENPSTRPLDTSPSSVSPCEQTCKGNHPSNDHTCGGNGFRMDDAGLPSEGPEVLEEGQPTASPIEVEQNAAPGSKESQMEAQEEERRKQWEEEDVDEQAAWLAMRGDEETLEEELKLTKEEIARLLKDKYTDALEHIFEPERKAALAQRMALAGAENQGLKVRSLALSEGFAASRRLLAGEERDEEGQTTTEDKDIPIAHLLGNFNLELTQEERETLFDLEGGEWGDNDCPNKDGDDGKAMPPREGRPRRRSRDPTSGILLFLRRCGQRRIPEKPPENPNAYGLLGSSPRHSPITKPDLDSYISHNFVGGKGASGQGIVTKDVEQAKEVEDADNVSQDCEEGGGRQPESSENDEVGIIWRESTSRKKRGESSTPNGRYGQDDFEGDGHLNLYYRRVGSSVSDLDEKNAMARSAGKTCRGRPAPPDPLEWMDRLHAEEEVGISDAVAGSDRMLDNLGEIGDVDSANSAQSIMDERTEEISSKDAVESSLSSPVGTTESDDSGTAPFAEIDKAQGRDRPTRVALGITSNEYASPIVIRRIAGEVLEGEEDRDERAGKSKGDAGRCTMLTDDWGKHVSLGIHMDDTLSCIHNEIASGASLTIRQSQESMVIKHAKRPPQSAKERVLPTRRKKDKESLVGDPRRHRRPLTRPCSVDNRAENPSIVFDPRPPWLQPLESVFAPRVPGSAHRGYPSTERGSPQHQQSKACSTGRHIDAGAVLGKSSYKSLMLRGGLSLLRRRPYSRSAPQRANSYARWKEMGRGVGGGNEGRAIVTWIEEEAKLSAQKLRRCGSASNTAILRLGEIHGVQKQAPATEDGISSWGWHDDSSQESPQGSTGVFNPGVTSEASTQANRTMLRCTSPKRSGDRRNVPHDDLLDTTPSSGCGRKKWRAAKTSDALDETPWPTGEFQVGEDIEGEQIKCSLKRAETAEGKDRGVLPAGVTQINPSEVTESPGEELKIHGELAREDAVSLARNAEIAKEEVVDSVSSKKGRQVSFADEPHGGFSLESAVCNKESNCLSGRILSGVIVGSYQGGKSETKSWTGRRTSVEKRSHYETEILQTARELLFNDTRPDGLRPVTGTPMENGRIASEPGGLYVGLSGLRGFDPSFSGAASNRTEAGNLEVLRPQTCPRSTGVPSEPSGDETTPTAPFRPASNDDVSWVVGGYLLDCESEEQREIRGTRKICDTGASPKATAAVSLFAQKPAVLWSAANLSTDDLVPTPSRRDRKTRLLTASNYTSKALLGAYKRMHPVFQVKASSWRRHKEAIPGIDYPAPPARWGDSESTLPPADREKALKAFEELPISRAEAEALREVAISRSKDERIFGRTGRALTAGEPFRKKEATSYIAFDADAAWSFSSQSGSDSTSSRPDIESTGDIKSMVPAPFQEEQQPARTSSENVEPSAGNNLEEPCREPKLAPAVLPLQQSPDRSRSMRKDKAAGTDIVAKGKLGTEQSVEEELRHRKQGMEVLIWEADASTAASSQMISRRSGVSAEEVLGTTLSVYSDGQTLIPSVGNVFASPTMSMSRSACSLRGEADVDDALRAMLRLSNPVGKIYEAYLSSMQQPCLTFITGMRERLWSRERELPLAPTRGIKRGILSRGGTRAIKSTRRGDAWATNAQDLTIEGKMLGSKKGVHQRLSRPRERRSPPKGWYIPGGDGGEWTDFGIIQSRSAPGLGQRESLGGRTTMVSMNDNLSSFKIIGTCPSICSATSNMSRPPSCQHPEHINGSQSGFIDVKRCVGSGGPSPISAIRGQISNQRLYRSPQNSPVEPHEEHLGEGVRIFAERNFPVDKTMEGAVYPPQSEKKSSFGELDSTLDFLASDFLMPKDHVSDSDDKKTGSAMSVITAGVTKNAAFVISAGGKDDAPSSTRSGQPRSCDRSHSAAPPSSRKPFIEATTNDAESGHTDVIYSGRRGSCSIRRDTKRSTLPGKIAGMNGCYFNSDGKIGSIYATEYEPRRDEGMVRIAGAGDTEIISSMAVESSDHLGSSMALTGTVCPMTNRSPCDGEPVKPLDENKKESENRYRSQTMSGSDIGGGETRKTPSHSKKLANTNSSRNMETSVGGQDNKGGGKEKARKVKHVRQIDHTSAPRDYGHANGQSPTAGVLPRLTKGGAAIGTPSAQECGEHQRRFLASEVKDARVPKIIERVDGGGGDRKLPTIEQDAARQRGSTREAGKKGEGDVDSGNIIVHTRPERAEGKDLETTTEALTTHHLSIDELLQEPVIVTRAVRTKDMAYWQTEEVKEREKLYRLHSTARTAASESGDASASDWQKVGDTNCSLGYADKWEDEKEEVKRLLPGARQRRLSGIARARAERRRQVQSASQIDNKSGGTSTVHGNSLPTGDLSKALHATKDESESALAKRGAGASTATVITTEINATNPGTEEVPGSRHQTEDSFLETRSKREEGGGPLWKGFRINEEEEAMLKRRQVRAQEKEPTAIKIADDWERQLLVPGPEDKLVNFHTDSSPIRSKFGRLRRGIKMRGKMNVDKDAQYNSKGENPGG